MAKSSIFLHRKSTQSWTAAKIRSPSFGGQLYGRRRTAGTPPFGALAAAPGINALAGGDAPLRFPGNAIPLSGGLASAGGRLMAAGMFLLAFDLLRQRPATDAQKSAPPAK